MGLKKEIVYRKAQKADYPAIREFIRQENKDIWECDSEKTEKRLSKLLFYQYMLEKNTFLVATYRDQLIGAILVGGKKKVAPVYWLKKMFTFLHLKMTKEGRVNLKILNQILEMQEKLFHEVEGKRYSLLLFYIHKNYRRNGAGTGLLNHLEEVEKKNLYVCVDQENNLGFLEKHGFVKIGYEGKMMEVRKRRFRENIFLYRYGAEGK